jgi:hypothetical protein
MSSNIDIWIDNVYVTPQET